MAPSELLVKNSEGILDQQTTTARYLFYGARSTPMTLQVVHRDKAQAKAALEAKHGKVPEVYAPCAVHRSRLPLWKTQRPLGSFWKPVGREQVWRLWRARSAYMRVQSLDYHGEWVNGVPSYNLIAKW